MKIQKAKINIPFIAVVESWLKPYVLDAQLYIEGFQIFRADRKHSKNGGTLLYINDQICVDISESYDDDICSGIVCLSKNSKSIIISIYRPPSATKESFKNLINFLNNFLCVHNELNKYSVIIFGDFNFPGIAWGKEENEIFNNKENSRTDLINFSENLYLTQCVDKCTRNNNILDLVFTNDQDSIQHIQVLDTSISDHRLLKIYNSFYPHLTLNREHADTSPNSQSINFFEINLESSDFNKINDEFSQTDWSKIIDKDFENFPTNFSSYVFDVLGKFSKLKSKKPFITVSKRKINCINRKIKKLRKRLIAINKNSVKTITINNKIQSLITDKKNILFKNKLDAENKAAKNIHSDSKYFF